MAIYGNTLSDLQAGKNAAQGLDYSRANAQDATSQQRLEAFLRLRGEQARIQAQQNQLAADRAMRMAELLQQNQQFGTREANLMKLGELEAKTRENVARTTAEGRGVDPRVYQTIADIQATNQAKQQRYDYLNQLSQKRIALKKKEKDMMANRGFMDFGDPNAGFFDRRVSPEWTQLQKSLTELDLEAAKQVDPTTGIGVVVDPDTGGYILAPANKIPIPDMLRSGAGLPIQAPGVNPLPEIQPSGAQIPAMFQSGGDVTIGGVPLNNFIDSAPAVDGLAPSTVAPPVSRFRWTPQGVVAY